MAESLTPDQALIDRYLQNRMSGEEEARFETWLLDNPDAASDLEYQLALRNGVKQGAAPATSRRGASRHILVQWLTWLTRPMVAAPVAVVALALMLTPTVMLIQLSRHTDSLRQDLELLSQPVALVSELPLELTRGSDATPDARIVLTANPSIVVIRVAVDAWVDQVNTYDIELSTAADTSRLENVSPLSNRLNVSVNTAVLEPGRLDLVLYGDGVEINRYWIAVEPLP